MTRLAIALATLVAIAAPAEAREHRAWSYAQLRAAADLIVIVVPRGTTATGRRAALPDITRLDPSGRPSAVIGERLETSLEVVTVLKGKPLDVRGKAATRIVLHHYREVSTALTADGPGLVHFEPGDKRQYLVFLVREKDGRYAAVSGQTDPDMSVEPLKQHLP